MSGGGFTHGSTADGISFVQTCTDPGTCDVCSGGDDVDDYDCELFGSTASIYGRRGLTGAKIRVAGQGIVIIDSSNGDSSWL